MLDTTIAELIASRPKPPFEWPAVRRLSMIGTLVGGLAGALLVGLWWTKPLGLSELGAGVITGLMAGAPFGAVCGAVVAPIAGLVFLRPVPMWLALCCTFVGTMCGGCVGLVNTLWFAIDRPGPHPLRGGVGGFIAGMLVARWVASRMTVRVIARAQVSARAAS